MLAEVVPRCDFACMLQPTLAISAVGKIQTYDYTVCYTLVKRAQSE